MKKVIWLLVLLSGMLLVACQQDESSPVVEEEGQPEETAVSTVVVTDVAEDPASIYMDATRPVDERVEALLGVMTLEEKVGQMTLVEKNSIDPEHITTQFIGGLLSGGGGSPRRNNPAAWAEMVDGFQERAMATRLQIPLIYGVDAVHGHSNLEGSVIFPHNIGLGATRNAELVTEIGRITAIETAATGIYWNYAPAVSVPRDIRWGRTYEGYSENTEVVTELSTAYLIGLQGEDLSNVDTVLATPKHFVGDGGVVWATSKTYPIDRGVTEIDEAGLRAIHLPPYLSAIDAGAMSIMVSYSSWGGMKMHAQQYLITDVLKEELGFEGFVVSDWGAIDEIKPSEYYESVVIAINAGIDMNMVPTKYDLFIFALVSAVEAGDVPIERIDDAVRRILRVKFELGLFERPFSDASLLDQVGIETHREVARQAVRESAVLLKNDNQTLPIAKDTPTIFVAGQDANDIGIQSGGWTIEWQGKPGNITPGTTILEAIEETVGPEVNLHFNRFGNYDRINDADGNPIIADVGIVVIGEEPYAEGVGDSDDLTLSEPDINLIMRVKERSERVVLILLSGRPLIITEQLPLVDALVAAWLPGTEGQGLTDVLFGDYPFTGKLSFSWPRSMDQIPFDFDNMSTEGCGAPLFAFGYGLSGTETAVLEVLDCE